ncbi:MAG TPA: hypothetical protein VJY15_03535, partial [Candidatus Acidoferrum sp.]|nr:hypothetical protein [Candidatus Acidoferrum sp.]
MPVAVRHQCRRGGNDVAKGGDKGLDGLDRTPQVEGVGFLERMLERPNEGRGDVADILQVLQAAVADVVTAADRDGLDRLGRLTRHAEVSPHAIDGPGSQADARDSLIEPVHPGVQLVANLVGPVMAQGHQPNLVADASLCTCTLRARTVHCRRAGIDHALDLILERHGRLEDRQ